MENNEWLIELWKGEEIIQKYKNNTLKIPRYQRSYVWDDQKKKNFLESLRKKWPTGVVLVQKIDNKYYIIDGLQRSTTLATYWLLWNSHPGIINNPEIYENALEAYKQNYGNNYYDTIYDNVSKYFQDLINFYWRESMNNDFLNLNIQTRVEKALSNFSLVENAKKCMRNFLIKFDEQLLKALEKIRNYKILVQIWEGNFEDAPLIFKEINTQGVKLTALMIMASNWTKEISIEWENNNYANKFKEINSRRFQNLLDTKIINISNLQGQQEESKTFGAMEIIYFICFEIIEKLKEKNVFYKVFIKKKEIYLEAMVTLIKTYIKFKNDELVFIHTKNLDSKIFKYFKNENDIKIAINEIYEHIIQFTNKIGFLYEKDNKISKSFETKTKFWIFLLALSIKQNNDLSYKKIILFMLHHFCQKSPLVNKLDHFIDLDAKITSNSFYKEINKKELSTKLQYEFFQEEFEKNYKKGKPEWKILIIAKMIYLKNFLSDIPKSFVVGSYFKDNDFAKKHDGLKNFNVFSNFGFYNSKNDIDLTIENDILFNRQTNKWLDKHWDSDGESMIETIKKAYENFKKHQKINNQFEMNKHLRIFLEIRAALMIRTLIHYL